MAAPEMAGSMLACSRDPAGLGCRWCCCCCCPGGACRWLRLCWTARSWSWRTGRYQN